MVRRVREHSSDDPVILARYTVYEHTEQHEIVVLVKVVRNDEHNPAHQQKSSGRQHEGELPAEVVADRAENRVREEARHEATQRHVEHPSRRLRTHVALETPYLRPVAVPVAALNGHLTNILGAPVRHLHVLRVILDALHALGVEDERLVDEQEGAV